jgi:hypothetical protein
MIIYTNGCSHSIGINGGYSWSYIISKSFFRDGKYIRKKISSDKHDNIIVENVIKNKTNLLMFSKTTSDNESLINHDILDKTHNILYNSADSGKGNDLIYHQTLEYLSECKSRNIKPDYVFIQWSGANRVSMQDTPYTLNMYTPANTINNLNFEPYGSIQTISYMFSLQEILKSMDIEYYFCCYMELSDRVKSFHLYKQLDLSKFITFDKESHPLFSGFRNLMRKKGYVMDGNGHPNYFGHWFLANKFLEKIDVDNLDIDFYNHLTMLLKGRRDFVKLVNFYTDNMIPKNRTKSLWKKLGEATEEIKDKFRKSIF